MDIEQKEEEDEKHKKKRNKLTRKSPVRHKVRSHTRKNKHVSNYNRGSGVKKINPFVSKRKVMKEKKIEKWKVMTPSILKRIGIKEEENNYIFYHASYRKNKESILSEGLKPARLKSPEKDEPRFPILYFSPTEKEALWIFPDIEEKPEMADEPIDIYKVRVSKKNIIRQDPYGSDVYSPGSGVSVFITQQIHPRNLELIT